MGGTVVKMSLWAGTATATVTVMALLASGAAHGSAAPTNLINAGSGDEFTPANDGTTLATQLSAQNLLTATQALASFQATDPEFNPGTTVAYQLGILTQSPDDQDAVPAGTPVWGLSWHSCPESHGPASASMPSNPCTRWLFLDAKTGRMIVMEYEIPAPTSQAHLATLPGSTTP